MSLKSLLLGCTVCAALAPVAHAAEEVRLDEIIVTASPIGRSVEETIIGTSVIGKDELNARLENTIGETLRREPGVSSTSFGPGASRPVIRGLGGDRISVLDAGIGAIDASATSPDHAVSVEPATAERIEIVRGPATLLYGSSAAGGAVNVFSAKIPRALAEGADGALRIGKTTVDDGVEAAGGITFNGPSLGSGAIVIHGEGHYREAEDYKVPGFVESADLRADEDAEAILAGEPLENHPFGLAENSAYKTKGGAVGASFVFDAGFIGVAATANDTYYGVPGRSHAEEEGGVSVKLKQRRFDVDGELDKDLLLFKRAKVRFGYADYEHREIEPNGDVGTTFTNEGFESRFELIDKTTSLLGGELNGAIGVQFKKRDFAALGEEAFTPPTLTKQFGVFALKELSLGAFRLEAGARFENTRHDVKTTLAHREFNAASVSAGLGYEPSEGLFFGVTGFRTERAPSTEELFSDGPHLATGSYEVGDPALGEEVGRGFEATARIGGERVAFSVNGFYTSYRKFIYEAETGAVIDDLPVFAYVADDATFKGLEASFEAELFRFGRFDVHGDAAFDYVRAGADSPAGKFDLPRIPPKSGLFGLEAKSALFDLRAEVEWAGRQVRIAPSELPTDSHTLYNAYLAIRPLRDNDAVTLRIAATNLTNEEARNHASFLKDALAQPGRNIRFSIAGSF